jgi:Lrp/AsnC family leucine-responsive transcriptional regulator
MSLTSSGLEKKLDDVDLELIRQLRQDGRKRVTKIADEIGRSPAAVTERIHSLEDGGQGYIRQYRAIIDYHKLGLREEAVVELKVGVGLQRDLNEIQQKLSKLPEVDWMAWVTGDYDAVLFVRACNAQHLRHVLFDIADAAGRGSTTRTAWLLETVIDDNVNVFEAIKRGGALDEKTKRSGARLGKAGGDGDV